MTLIDTVLGACIRNIPSTEKVLYLTFDDGPHEHCTPKVLDLLSQHQASATFFVVAKALQKNLSLGHSIVSQGHSVGNHSLDHRYHHYFHHDRYLMKWVGRAKDMIEQSLHVQTIGFRSPFGIRTPHLGMALRKLQYPLIHWNQRFFDTQRGLPSNALIMRISQFRSGDILLLHDTHIKYHQSFLQGLEYLLLNAHTAGFSFKAIPNDFVHRQRQPPTSFLSTSVETKGKTG